MNTITEYLRAHPSASDLDVAIALSTPTKTPKGGNVTLRTLGATWGLTRSVQFRAYLLSLGSGVAGAQTAAFAQTVLALLDGPGFDPAHPDVAAAVGQLVNAGACTADEADAVLYDTTYIAGGPITESNVAAARAALTRRDTFDALRQAWAAKYNAGVATIDQAEAGGGAAPDIGGL